MTSRQNLVKLFAASLFTFTFTAGQAASVYLTPASSTVISPGTTTLELFMDFTGDPTIGGGIDLDLSSGISVASFTPSAYWVSDIDPAFAGYGTANADADFEIHFGNFSGLVGVNKLGDLTINLLGLGSQSIAMNINDFWGDFYSTAGPIQSVDLLGATLELTAVPVPGAVWLMMSALGALVAPRMRRAPKA